MGKLEIEKRTEVAESARIENKIGKENAKHVLWSGKIDAEDGQKLYVIEWGKRDGSPMICLHGGPGDSFKESHVALFNNRTDHVIFFDQRGCGESTPSAAVQTKEEIQLGNTPAHIIADMEKLRKHFDMEKMHVAGGSWGSTLALLYAIEHPDKTASLQLWSLFLATKEQRDSIFEDKTRHDNFPEMCREPWDEFIGLVPKDKRGYDEKGSVNPALILEYYASDKGTNHPNPAIARKYAEAYLIYEYALCQPDGSDSDPSATLEKIRNDITGDANSLAAARIEMTYQVNDMFIEENRILNNAERIKDIPIKIVQGKRDWCTPTKFARMLEAKLGFQCVDEVASGHLRNDKEMQRKIKENISRAHISN